MSGSLLANITYAGIDNRIYALKSEISGTSTFQTAFISSLEADQVSTVLLEANEASVSTISAYEVFIDNQGLTATSTELLLNGIPLATTSNLSSIADWSLDPAITTVNMAGNDLINANVIEAGQVVSLLGNFQELYTSSLTASTIVCNELVALSTIQTYNYLSTQIVRTDVVSSSVVNANAILASTFNGYTVGDFLSSSAIPSTITLSSIILNIGKNSTFTIQGDAASAPTMPPQVNITAPYNVNLTLGAQNPPPDYDFNDPGFLKLTGGLYIADPRQVIYGANFTASSNNDYNFTINPTKSLIVQPNNPGTALIAQTLDGSQDQKGIRWLDIQVSPSATFSQEMWVNNGYLQTNGGFTVGNNLLAGSNIQTSTINGYTISDFLSTSASQYDPNPLFSTLVININGFISTPDLEVSSINGHEINQNTVIISSVQTNKLTAVEISSVVGDVTLQLVSTLSFSGSLGSNSFSLGGIDLGLGNIFGQITGGALGIMSLVTSGVALGTGVAALHQTRGTKNINATNYELVNGTTQLQISTIPDSVSTIYRFSSGNPADQVIGSEVFISTISPPGTFIRSMSDPLNTVSSPTSTIQAFGQWIPLPIPLMSSIADWSFEPALTNVNMDGYELQNVGNVMMASGAAIDFGVAPATNITSGGLTAQLATMSTIEFLPSTIITGSQFYQEFQVLNRENLSTAQILVNAVKYAGQVDQLNPAFGSYSYLQDRAIYTNSSFSTHYVAYLDDLSTVSTFVELYTSNINASNINVNTISTGQTLTLTGGASIEFRVADGTNINHGALSVQPNGTMSLVADMPNSEVSVPTVNTDTIGAKNVSQITITANLEQQSGYYISTGQVYTNNIKAPTPAGVVIQSEDNTSQLTIGNGTADIQVNGDILFYSVAPAGNINLNAPSTSVVSRMYVGTSISTPQLGVSSITLTGLPNSTITIATTATAGSVAPAGRLVISGADVDLGQNDLYAQQVRLGFGNPGGSAQTELIMYPPDGTNPKGFNAAGADPTLRIVSTLNSGTGGYLLDTLLNPPIFSTINNSIALVSRFPAATTGTIGYSTITTSQNYIFSAYSSTSQTVLAANTATNLEHNTVTTNVGGFTNLGSTITVPVAGVYEIGTSIQFVTSSGGTNNAYFWLKKNGVNVDQTNSKVSVVNNGDTIGTVSFFDTAAANDKYTIAIESSDANMQAGAIAATGDMPAVPSVITNIKKIG